VHNAAFEAEAAEPEAVEADTPGGQSTPSTKAMIKTLNLIDRKLSKLKTRSYLNCFRRCEVRLLLTFKHYFDRDGDGRVTLEEILTDEVTASSNVCQEELMTQHLPIFTATQVGLCIGLWMVFAIKKNSFLGVCGLDSLFEDQTNMQVHDDCKDTRSQLWRWLTYQYSHMGLAHLMTNSLIVIILGVPLEGFHGSWRFAGIFNIGVLCGSLGFIVSNPHAKVVGMSGGCYALMGMHLADLLINFAEKKYRSITILGLLTLACVDVASYALKTGDDTTSYSSHIGGVTGGLLFGVLFQRNLRVRKCERVLQVISAVVAAMAIVFCLMWFLHWPPRSIWDITPWCWARQVSNHSLFGTARYVCVRCYSLECVQQWEQQLHKQKVDPWICGKRGLWYYTEP